MMDFAPTLTVELNLRLEGLKPAPALPAQGSFWRVKHDSTLWRANLPEVFPFDPNHFTRFSRGWQLLSKAINPSLSGQQWRAVYGWQRAFTNQQGFNRPGDPRADFVNMLDIGAEVPRQEALCCGGAILKEKSRDGEYLYPEYLDGNESPPSSMYVLLRPWLMFDAVTVVGTTDGIKIRMFPQGEGTPVKILLLASKPIRIPLSKVERVGEPFPSPYQYP